jgi:hypothetical protein
MSGIDYTTPLYLGESTIMYDAGQVGQTGSVFPGYTSNNDQIVGKWQGATGSVIDFSNQDEYPCQYMRGIPEPINNGDDSQPINVGYLTSGTLSGLTVKGTINALFAEVQQGSFVSGIGVNSTNRENFVKTLINGTETITSNGKAAAVYNGPIGTVGEDGDMFLPLPGATGTFYGGIELYNGLSMNDQPLAGYHIVGRRGITGSVSWNKDYSKNLNTVNQIHFQPNQQNTLQVLTMKVDYLLCHLFGSNDLRYLLKNNTNAASMAGNIGNTVALDSPLTAWSPS